MRAFVLGLGVAALLLLPAWGFFGEPTATGEALEGRVLEFGSDRPVAGAVVLAFWSGEVASLADSSLVCFHVASATTDAQGRYRTAAWRKQTKFARSKHQGIAITAFKPGYRKMRTVDQTVYVEPFQGSREDWLKYLHVALRDAGCPNAGASKKQIAPWVEALRLEAEKAAVTSEERKFLEILDIKMSLLLVDEDKPIGFDEKGRAYNIGQKGESK